MPEGEKERISIAELKVHLDYTNQSLDEINRSLRDVNDNVGGLREDNAVFHQHIDNEQSAKNRLTGYLTLLVITVSAVVTAIISFVTN